MAGRLRIALITDIHYGDDDPTKRGSVALQLLDGALDEMDEWQPDLMVDLGDRLNERDEETDLTRLRALHERFQRLDVPRVHLQGNHDVAKLSVEASERALDTDLRHRSFDANGWHLVFWYADVSYESRVGNLTLTEDDLAWLRADLAATRLPTVLFSHVPLDDGSMIGNYYFEHKPFGRAGYKNAYLARAIVEQSDRVMLAVAGHVHWNVLNTIDGVHYVTIQSLSETFTTAPHPVRTWAELILGDVIELRVHGKDPISFSLPTRRRQRHWLAYGGKANPVPRDHVARSVLERKCGD